MPTEAVSLHIAADQQVSSPAEWFLIVTITVLGVCCALVFIGGARIGGLGLLTATLFLLLTRSAALALGTGQSMAWLLAVAISEIAFLTTCLSIAAVLDHREQLKREVETARWKRHQLEPRSMDEMRDYWNRGD